ncbi:zinc ribbon domain-containing protein [Candidatus Bathyarchaeota archaeon]|nr:zinc ribbon domain-containing protein [Candidatus Bathyarchaeota archaeon]
MSHCPKCGIRLPEDENALFCPNCGAPVSRIIKSRAAKIHWTGSLKSRALVFLVVFTLCIGVTLISALTRIERSEANGIMQEMSKLEDVIKSYGVQIIFGNNLIHTLIMFIPVAGPCWGTYVLYKTGRVFAAYSILYDVDAATLFSTVFILPFAWMEYLSYALAISESLWMIYAVIKRNFRNEIIVASVTIVLCNVILLLAALVEVALTISL